MSYDTPSSDEESAAPFIISHGHEIKNNLKFLRMNDSFNDVKIIFSDGIVCANSVIMSSASDYFSTMLNSDKFVEAQTKEVSMEEYGTKEAMERMVDYIYSGDMNLGETGFEILLEIMNLSKMLLLRTDSLFTSLEAYIISFISDGCLSLPNDLRGFLLVERYCLDSLRKHIIFDIYASLRCKNMEDEAGAILQQFNVKMIKEIMLYKYNPVDRRTKKKFVAPPYSKEKFQCFQVWYSKNQDCKDEDKKIIRDSIDLDEFTGEELLTVVKKSGLFPEEDVTQKCIEKFRKTNQ